MKSYAEVISICVFAIKEHLTSYNCNSMKMSKRTSKGGSAVRKKFQK